MGFQSRFKSQSTTPYVPGGRGHFGHFDQGHHARRQQHQHQHQASGQSSQSEQSRQGNRREGERERGIEEQEQEQEQEQVRGQGQGHAGGMKRKFGVTQSTDNLVYESYKKTQNFHRR